MTISDGNLYTHQWYWWAKYLTCCLVPSKVSTSVSICVRVGFLSRLVLLWLLGFLSSSIVLSLPNLHQYGSSLVDGDGVLHSAELGPVWHWFLVACV